MRLLLAGATRVVGKEMVPRLVAAGHEVVGTTRDPGKVETLRRLGAAPLLLDVLDGKTVEASLAKVRPDAIVHQLTSLAHGDHAANNRLRISQDDGSVIPPELEREQAPIRPGH